METSGVRLLALLDALVQRDCGPAGFTGSLAVGVRSDAGETWWIAEFGRRVTTRFVHDAAALPKLLDAQLILGVTDAERIIMHGALQHDGAAVHAQGDGDLMTKFLDRYVEPQSLLQLRARTDQDASMPRGRSRIRSQ